MAWDKKLATLIVITILLIIGTYLLHPINQDNSYHLFADHISYWGIPNALNVLTNLPFLFVGAYGLAKLAVDKTTAQAIKRMYAILFLGILLTGLGSAYYHLLPDNYRLLWDRLPMTIIFMSFLAVVVYEWISPRLGTWLLFPLLLFGTASLLWWNYTELQGQGDLRAYLFVQFYPMVIIPVIFWLYQVPAKNRKIAWLGWVFFWYIIAKAAEMLDDQLFTLTGFISGHSIKHLAAAMATWYMVKFYERSYQTSVVT